MKGKLLLGIFGSVLALGVAHIYINVGFDKFAADVKGMFAEKREELIVGFLPVTCHLTCPVVDWTTRHSESGSMYKSKRYSDFPTLCEDLTQGTLTAAFLNAPLAISLAEKGVPVKFVTLGHRDGSAIVVPTASEVQDFPGLVGKKILIPSKFSNQQLWLARLCKQNGVKLSDLNLVVAPPPDMPALLESGQCDAYVVGEPHCARAEMQGSGRILLQVKDSWPNFISCGLVVRQSLIDSNPDLIQELVDGIHGSGMWLEQNVENRFSAADVVGKYYYNQKPELLKFVLSKPVDRVRYDALTPLKPDFDEIMDLALEVGMFKTRIEFEKYADARFAVGAPKVAIAMPPDDGLGLTVAVAPPKAADAPAQPAATPPTPAAGTPTK
ncbi:MAG: ABC transporter substrate-binding protein [Planctomycetes bacterium]|nr:ABC transporter substrate-binding protein [Planctomycetota bacterium]